MLLKIKRNYFEINCFYVRYLLELDCEGDPAWDCITNMCKGIVRLLQSSKDEFQSQPTNTTGIELHTCNSVFACGN